MPMAHEYPAEQQYPAEQLRLVHDELNRQVLSASSKHQGMRDRANILPGAAAIGVAFYASHLGSLMGLIVAIFSVAAALFGLWTLRPTKGLDVIMRDLRLNSLGAPDLYSAEYQLVDDKIKALESYEVSLDKKAKQISAGFLFLVVSWIFVILGLAIN